MIELCLIPFFRDKQILEMIDQGVTRQEIADQLSIGIASVYRILKEHRSNL